MKKILAIGIVLIICISLCACGISKEEAIGTWSASWVYNGNNISSAFVLEVDGTFSEVTYRNGSLSSTLTGTYEIEGSKVFLYENGNKGSFMEFKYSGGALVNAGHKYYKK